MGEQVPENPGFRVVGARGADWSRMLRAVLHQLEPMPGTHNVGFVYVSGVAADMVDTFLGALRERSGIQSWVGAVASEVMVPGCHHWCPDGVVIATGYLPPERFEVIRRHDLPRGRPQGVAILHIDEAFAGDMIGGESHMSAASRDDVVIGGMVGGTGGPTQIADSLASGGVSGLWLDQTVPVRCRHSHGCSMLGPFHEVMSTRPGVIGRLDGRPVAEVLREQVGDILWRRPERLAEHVYLAAPLEAARFQVLPIEAIDLERNALEIPVERVPTRLAIALRDPGAALDDLKVQLADLRAPTGSHERGPLWLHLASNRRQQGLFGPETDEPSIVRNRIGHPAVIGATFRYEVFGMEAHALSSVTACLG